MRRTARACTVRENRTNTPLQALDLMNDVAFLEAARKLAERMLTEGGSAPQQRIAYGFRLVLARAPKPQEEHDSGEVCLRVSKQLTADDPQAAEQVPERRRISDRDPQLNVAGTGGLHQRGQHDVEPGRDDHQGVRDGQLRRSPLRLHDAPAFLRERTLGAGHGGAGQL